MKNRFVCFPVDHSPCCNVSQLDPAQRLPDTAGYRGKAHGCFGQSGVGWEENCLGSRAAGTSDRAGSRDAVS